MENLYDRLLWICHDQGIETRHQGKAICELLGISSGRPSQIKNEGAAAKLNEEQMSKLTAKGYARDWVANGKEPRKDKDVFRGSELSEQAKRFGRLYDSLKPEHQLKAFADLKRYALEMAAQDDDYLESIVNLITKKR